MMKVRTNNKINGYVIRTVLMVDINPPVDNIKNVTYRMVGVTEEGNGKINLLTGKLIFDTPVTVEPYEEIGKPKVITELKIEKYVLLQIKSYLEV